MLVALSMIGSRLSPLNLLFPHDPPGLSGEIP